jgi:hypothetical protein
LASVGGPLDFLDRSIKSFKDQTTKENRSIDEIKVLTLTFPQIYEGKSNNNNNNIEGGQQQSQRFPLTGTIEEIGRYSKN